jgi:hypothetical protein
MFELFLDSSQRIANSTTTAAEFLLNRDVIGIKSVSIISASFSNLTYNITEQNNSASFGNIPPQYYNSSDFVSAVNSLLGSGGSVLFNSETNTLAWNLSTAIQIYSGLTDILGLSPLFVYNGTFNSTRSLARPSAVSFVCQSLQTFSGNAHVQGIRNGGRALFTTHIDVGYGQVQTVREATPYVQTVNGANLSLIQIEILDPSTGRKLLEAEMPLWSLILRIQTQ